MRKLLLLLSLVFLSVPGEAHAFSKDTFVEFLPEGKLEPCELRIAAFKNQKLILAAINDVFDLSQPTKKRKTMANTKATLGILEAGKEAIDGHLPPIKKRFVVNATNTI